MNNREKKELNKVIGHFENHPKYTQEEISLISNTFFDRDDILMAIRKFFLQATLKEKEESLIRTLTEDTIKVLRKCILPEVSFHSPLVIGKDLWGRIDMTNKLMEDTYWEIKSENIMIVYLNEQFARLEKEEGIKILLDSLIFDDSKSVEEACYELKARNKIINHVDETMREIRTLAISASEASQEEKRKRITMDSNQ